MRNEIFSQIKRNRKRYYSELKTTEVKTSKPETVVKEHSNKIGEKTNNVEANKFNANPKINTQRFHFNIKPMVQFGNSFSSYTINILTKGNTRFDKLNQSLIEFTGKITQWFYKVSSGFFEDPNDTEDYSEELNFRSSNPGLHERSGTLNFVGVSQQGTITLEVTYLTSQERVMLWLNKQYQRAVLFFESDELTEIKEVNSQKLEPKEISINERRMDSKTSIIEVNYGIESAEKEKEVNIVFRRLYSLILNHPIITSVNIMSTVELMMIFGKKALLTIFPIINRFI